jgi:hypothetical protein
MAAFAMPNDSVHLLFSKMLPYQTLAKFRALFIIAISSHKRTGKYSLEPFNIFLRKRLHFGRLSPWSGTNSRLFARRSGRKRKGVPIAVPIRLGKA